MEPKQNTPEMSQQEQDLRRMGGRKYVRKVMEALSTGGDVEIVLSDNGDRIEYRKRAEYPSTWLFDSIEKARDAVNEAGYTFVLQYLQQKRKLGY